MSPADKDKLEEQLLQKPDDVEARTKLLGYYFLRSLRDSEDKLAKRQHILWLIEHAPETEVLGSPLSHINNSLDAEGYRQVHAAWQQVIEENPEELSVLKNASRFYLLPDHKLA